MIPLTFGPERRRLFGFFHPPEVASTRSDAVLLCAPMGHEALRTHRFYRLLAVRLARRGIPVLRFDFYGTGDSPGDDEEGDLEGWRGDLRAAHRELIARSGATKVVWFGSRLGATLAAQAAADTQPMPVKLVLWEPVLDGARYLQALREKNVEELEWSMGLPSATWRRDLESDPDAFSGESLGFAISPLLRSQIRALTPSGVEPPRGLAVTLVAPPGETMSSDWLAACQATGATIRGVALTHSLVWTSNPGPNSELVPAEALQCMMEEIQ
ncbi:alpha/beta fold hydrolase [Variovorax sp. J22P168]|uniref:alpha/beta fold hydrolase n=1 Tax=Variovorax jilinensis TaxID=3053513 RepID=UPI0025790B9B|nr:alpha/beta fold hydrolase [Variovorax sp. J22P168]MDM0011238.1 alpha/beta fold hydrolase [Variovorax sp. J22P168]